MITWSPGVTLEQIELRVCSAAFAYFKQNKTMTAASLGISVRTLDAKLDALGKRAESEEQRRERAKQEAERELQYARFGGRPQMIISEDRIEFADSGSSFDETEESEVVETPPVTIQVQVSGALKSVTGTAVPEKRPTSAPAPAAVSAARRK